MRIVIVGAGVIGGSLARYLSEEKHEVFVVEKREERARKIDEKFDVKVVTGDGADPDVLLSAGLNDADLVLAVTASDETNLLVCSVASAYQVPQRIARIRKRSLRRVVQATGYTHFSVDEVVFPEDLACDDILMAIESPGVREIADFAKGKVYLQAFDVLSGSPLCGSKIGDLRQEDFPWPFVVIAIVRDAQALIPKGETVISECDRIYVMLPASSSCEF